MGGEVGIPLAELQNTKFPFHVFDRYGCHIQDSQDLITNTDLKDFAARFLSVLLIFEVFRFQQ